MGKDVQNMIEHDTSSYVKLTMLIIKGESWFYLLLKYTLKLFIEMDTKSKDKL